VCQGEDVGDGAVCELIVAVHHEFGPAPVNISNRSICQNQCQTWSLFDSPLSALLGPLEIAEVHHGNHDVGSNAKPCECGN
jgi:hypothetical protein